MESELEELKNLNIDLQQKSTAMVEEIKDLKAKNAELKKAQNMINFVLRMHNL